MIVVSFKSAAENLAMMLAEMLPQLFCLFPRIFGESDFATF